MVANALTAAPSHPVRAFGRFELRRLLGKSAATMAWLAFDPRSGTETMLTLPRVQPADAPALERWLRDARLAARLDHPNLARVAEVGVQDQWPYVAVDRACGETLAERLAALRDPAPTEVAAWFADALRGLAFAHDAGVAHRDLQLHAIVVDERGSVRLMALAAAGDAVPVEPSVRSNERAMALDPAELRVQRSLAARDVLGCGVLMHGLLAGQPALEQPDTGQVIARIAPLGRELVRLPWSTPRTVPEALRAIVNRCTSAQERLRYRSARTLLGALTGWLDAQALDGGGPVAVLVGRLDTVGHLPALPGLAARVARVTSLESQRTDEIADQVLEDMALTFELLRTLNSAQVQGTQIQGNGPVLTLRRIISLIGVNGVRLAANTLRPWPGPLGDGEAHALDATLEQVRLAGRAARALRPAGYDGQVVYLIAVLQNLGRLMLRYHFAAEADQVEQLMRPVAANPGAGIAEAPGLSEEAAGFAVLGVDVEALGEAVARHWGLGDDVMHMVRRVPPTVPVRRPDTDADVLRLTASAANDAVDALRLHHGARARTALAQVAQRYGRALGIGMRDLDDALIGAGGVAGAAPRQADAPQPARRADGAAAAGPAAATAPAAPADVGGAR